MKRAQQPQPIEQQTHVRLTVTHEQLQKKSLLEAYLLVVILGVTGAHHFYLRRPWYGIAYFLTFGLLGFGVLVDLFRLPCLVRDANMEIRDPQLCDKKTKLDAYVLWFPFGIIGLHLFYLRKPGQGLLYMFTFGMFGIGFLIDMFRIPYMVQEVNELPPGFKAPKSVAEAYLFGLSPLGILGAHHYYLNRPLWGILYTLTLGLYGFGWVYDWFRMPCLVDRANGITHGGTDPGLKYTDDTYILWFPFGIVGFHHYYLERPLWGLLYTCTFGLFGIGWIIDCCRLPCLVNDFNRRYAERQIIAQQTRAQFGGAIRTTACGQTLVTQNMQYGSTFTPPNSIMVSPPQYQPWAFQNSAMPGYQQNSGLPGYQQNEDLPVYQQNGVHHGYQQNGGLPGYQQYNGALPGNQQIGGHPGNQQNGGLPQQQNGGLPGNQQTGFQPQQNGGVSGDQQAGPPAENLGHPPPYTQATTDVKTQ